MMTIRVVLADDHRIIREGIRNLLDQEPDIDVVGEASDGREVILKNQELQPDVLIMDITMPNLNGIDATRKIIKQNPETRIIALSMHSDHHFVAEMLQAGATAYLLKDCVYDELVQAIQLVCQGKTYLSPEVASLLVKDYRSQSQQTTAAKSETLTPREREVLQLMAEGHSTKNIAEKLYLSAKTIEAHRAQIMRKLNIHNVAELTKYAIREGLTSL
jgi:DNA-binding NarL/FixJ family response regulator